MLVCEKHKYVDIVVLKHITRLHSIISIKRGVSGCTHLRSCVCWVWKIEILNCEKCYKNGCLTTMRHNGFQSQTTVKMFQKYFQFGIFQMPHDQGQHRQNALAYTISDYWKHDILFPLVDHLNTELIYFCR